MARCLQDTARPWRGCIRGHGVEDGPEEDSEPGTSTGLFPDCVSRSDPGSLRFSLGALSCFFEDVDSLDSNSTSALFSELKLCQNEAANQKVGSLVKKFLSGRVPNKDDLKNYGAAVSRLSHKVLKRITGEDLRDSIQYLGKDKGSKWGRPQAQQLVD
ncbi:hypothetical protein scyTo_0025355, partial [Scyliorhinus torazame]|nr:hypothetical protein [Scyliorhinus torazame]